MMNIMRQYGKFGILSNHVLNTKLKKSGKKIVEVHVEIFLEYKTLRATPLMETPSYISPLDKIQELALANMR